MLDFNQNNNPKYFKLDEIEYMINMLKDSKKDFASLDLLKPLFNKSFDTLEKIMDELNSMDVWDVEGEDRSAEDLASDKRATLERMLQAEDMEAAAATGKK